MTKRYFGEWAAPDDWRQPGLQGFDAMCNDFVIADGRVQDEHVLFAAYSQEDYEGHAFVLLLIEGKLYENHAAHCSCNGLEFQWEPEETRWSELAMRRFAELGEDARTALDELIQANTVAEGKR